MKNKLPQCAATNFRAAGKHSFKVYFSKSSAVANPSKAVAAAIVVDSLTALRCEMVAAPYRGKVKVRPPHNVLGGTAACQRNCFARRRHCFCIWLLASARFFAAILKPDYLVIYRHMIF